MTKTDELQRDTKQDTKQALKSKVVSMEQNSVEQVAELQTKAPKRRGRPRKTEAPLLAGLEESFATNTEASTESKVQSLHQDVEVVRSNGQAQSEALSMGQRASLSKGQTISPSKSQSVLPSDTQTTAPNAVPTDAFALAMQSALSKGQYQSLAVEQNSHVFSSGKATANSSNTVNSAITQHQEEQQFLSTNSSQATEQITAKVSKQTITKVPEQSIAHTSEHAIATAPKQARAQSAISQSANFQSAIPQSSALKAEGVNSTHAQMQRQDAQGAYEQASKVQGSYERGSNVPRADERGSNVPRADERGSNVPRADEQVPDEFYHQALEEFMGQSFAQGKSANVKADDFYLDSFDAVPDLPPDYMEDIPVSFDMPEYLVQGTTEAKTDGVLAQDAAKMAAFSQNTIADPNTVAHKQSLSQANFANSQVAPATAPYTAQPTAQYTAQSTAPYIAQAATQYGAQQNAQKVANTLALRTRNTKSIVDPQGIMGKGFTISEDRSSSDDIVVVQDDVNVQYDSGLQYTPNLETIFEEPDYFVADLPEINLNVEGQLEGTFLIDNLAPKETDEANATLKKHDKTKKEKAEEAALNRIKDASPLVKLADGILVPVDLLDDLPDFLRPLLKQGKEAIFEQTKKFLHPEEVPYEDRGYTYSKEDLVAIDYDPNDPSTVPSFIAHFRDPQLRQNAEAMKSWIVKSFHLKAIEKHLEEKKELVEEIVFRMAIAAQSCQPINMAYVDYMMKHYPMKTMEEQSAFNVVLLCMFQRMQEGHICVNLDSVFNLFRIIRDWNSLPTLEDKRLVLDMKANAAMALRDEMCLRTPKTNKELFSLIESASGITTDPSKELPLIWDLNRLYIRRYYQYEESISQYINSIPLEYFDESSEMRIKMMIDVLFPSDTDHLLPDGINWQKVAALMSTLSNFTVISGGPGTGKTTTVFKLLLLLLCFNDQNRRILMCAPTAKAANRMGESISRQLKDDVMQERIAKLCQLTGEDNEFIKSLIPMQAQTVHKLLKVRPHMATPIYNADNKLDCDVLIVDEVSMLELSLFAKLIAALPEGCKLILLGDKDQLSSVGAGMVLGDICSILDSTDPRRIQEQALDFISRMSGYAKESLLKGKIADHITLLQFSWRSKDVPQIGQLANLFNTSKIFDNVRFQDEVQDLMAQSPRDRVSLIMHVVKGEYIFHESKESVDYYNQRIKEIKALSFKANNPNNGQIFFDYVAKKVNKSLLEQLDLQAEAMGQEHLVGHFNRFNAPVVLYEIPEGIDPDNINITRKFKAQVVSMMQETLKEDALPQERELIAEAIKDPFAPRNFVMLRGIVDKIKKDRTQEVVFMRHSLIKAWVAPNGQDNYAPFLNQLKSMNFTVNPDNQDCVKLFELMDRFRILCSNHNDWFGDRNLNELLEAEILKQYLSDGAERFQPGEFFPGKIILITENDPLLNLVNGSVGFCAYVDYDSHDQSFAEYVQSKSQGILKKGKVDFTFSDTSNAQGKQLRVFIPMGVKEVNGESRTQINVISTLLLNHYESGYAMSIHKSQGSEYEHVAIVLSQKINPILTKELVYTGITRAMKRVELVATKEAIKYALSNKVVRDSGLALRLYDRNFLENNA